MKFSEIKVGETFSTKLLERVWIKSNDLEAVLIKTPDFSNSNRLGKQIIMSTKTDYILVEIEKIKPIAPKVYFEDIKVGEKFKIGQLSKKFIKVHINDIDGYYGYRSADKEDNCVIIVLNNPEVSRVD